MVFVTDMHRQERFSGIGPVEVHKPKARDRRAAEADKRIRFTSAILPKWARRTKSLDALLPALYLRGISAGDLQGSQKPIGVVPNTRLLKGDRWISLISMTNKRRKTMAFSQSRLLHCKCETASSSTRSVDCRSERGAPCK